jgi:flagellar biosynthetic protein FliR
VALDLNYVRLIAFLLVLVRAVAWLFVVPPFSDRNVIPSTVTMGIGAGLGVLIGPSIPASQIPTDDIGLIAAIVVNVTTGVAMGFLVNMLLTTVTTAGSLVDVSGGLNLPPAIDPLSTNQTPMIGQFYQQVALLLLFVSGGYLILIEGFARSFTAPGFTLAHSNTVADVLISDLGTYFLSAVEIAAPILVVLFATQVVLALISRAAPQMNVWILGMPIQIFLALTVVAIGISILPGEMGGIVSRITSDSGALFGKG